MNARPRTVNRFVSPRGGVLWLLCLVTSSISCNLSISANGAAAPGAQQQASANLPDEHPVILLTGFEPFGTARPPNPSWEGIKSLDGREWRGYRLVSKQMRVIWGAPLEQLQGWIAEYQPVAIFSFGQGGPSSFALESKASNDRGPFPDNDSHQAPRPTIAENGPTEYRATIDCPRLAQSLADKGYPIAVSSQAGRYLCEEALYSLEYLKATKQLDATVSFCHVPPLNATLRGERVTAPYVQKFVQELLESWYMIYQAKEPSAAAEQRGASETVDSRTQEVRQFIEGYFRTWSNQDMDGYAACFLPKASIQLIENDGQLTTYARPQFITMQRESHRRSPQRMTEVAESVDIRFEGNLAHVVAFWKLNLGPTNEFGYDHFTLMKQKGEWRIVHLVFYGVDPSQRPSPG